MTKAILLSVKPQHATKILNGKKTLELRKSVPQNFEGWVYIYITKPQRAGENLMWFDYTDNTAPTYALTYYGKDIMGEDILNGKVVARFWFDEYGELLFNLTHWRYEYNAQGSDVSQELCLTEEQIDTYTKGLKKAAKLWHIKQLDIFDKPKELNDFHYYKTKTVYSGMDCPPYVDEVKQTLRKAPQSWRYVWVD